MAESQQELTDKLNLPPWLAEKEPEPMSLPILLWWWKAILTSLCLVLLLSPSSAPLKSYFP